MVKYCAHCRLHPEKAFPPETPGYDPTYKDWVQECGICHGELKNLSMTSEEYWTLRDIKAPIELIDAMVELRDKDFLEFQTRMSQFRMEAAQVKAAQAQVSNKPKCPKCTSTNIQIVPRKWSLFAGFATNKTDRVCVNCKYKW